MADFLDRWWWWWLDKGAGGMTVGSSGSIEPKKDGEEERVLLFSKAG